MKNLSNKISVLLLTLFIILLSCNKDADVISNFPFTLNEVHSDTTTVNHPEKTTFNIVPERIVESTVYQFKYEVLSGEGAYLDEQGEPLPEETFVKLDNRNPQFPYRSAKIGKEKVRVTVQDNGLITETVDVVYEIQHNPYVLEFSTPFNQTVVKEPKPVTLGIFNTGKDKSVTFERAFFIIQGTGNLFKANSNEEFPLEKFEPITEGTFNYDISFEEFGESKILVTTRDSNQQIKNDTLTFEVDEIDINFTATAEKNSSFLGQEFNITFGLSEDQGAGGSYQMRYAVDLGEVSLEYNNEILSPGVLYDIELGGFIWKAVGSTPGPLKLSFTVKNDSGAELTREVIITVIDAGIVFDAVPLAAEIFIGESVSFNASIDEDPSAEPPYELKFVSSASGKLRYNEIEYNPGQIVSVVDANFSFDYTPLTVANHELTFTVENSIGIQAVDMENIMVKDPQLSFNTIPVANDAFVDIPVTINASLSEQPNAAPPYNLIFESTGTGTVTYNNVDYTPGVNIVINSAPFSMEYNPLSTGDHMVTFTIQNNIDVEGVDVVNLDVQEAQLSLDVVPSAPQAFIGEAVSYNASITQLPEANPPFSLSYSSSEVGFVRYKNIVRNPGQNFLVDDTQFSFEYSGNNSGNHEIVFTASNDFNAEGIDIVELDVIQPDYTFSTSAANSVVQGIILDIDHSLTPGAGQQTYQMKYVVNSGDVNMRHQGNALLNENTFHDVPNGNFDWRVSAKDGQNIDITFTVISNYGVQKQTQLLIDVTSTDFDFSLNNPNAIQTEDGEANIEVDLTGQNQFDYTIAYSINPNDGSRLLLNNNVVQQASSINIGVTDFLFDFVDAEQYSVEISLRSSAKPNNPVVRNANINVSHTPITFNVINANSVENNSPLALALNLSGSNNLSYSVSRSILNGSGSFNFGNNTPLNQGNNGFSYTPTTAGQHQLRFVVMDNFGNSVTVDKAFSVTEPAPVINHLTSNNYAKTGCAQDGPFIEECTLRLVLQWDVTSPSNVTHWRTRRNNVVGQEVAVLNFLPDVSIVPAGTVRIGHNDAIDENQITLRTSVAFDLQVKNADGHWSDWFPILSPNSYGLSYQ
ncbi:DUF3872 domain-containing protein [Flagellimonas hymeniacidonis]|uniref:DUF3872 domain-containing protein n=1 Tax=Flagellimonas hymeniacidonis TaxID=2603628 RepID=A0A5C8V8P4_9FLAO|nr:TraQ conjugal transfer family protein [Flagellimonas hymeniacidonis]TXN37713.1 DUF3872 domain-containing protein [Flagellimonas hymeniacidonis]